MGGLGLSLVMIPCLKAGAWAHWHGVCLPWMPGGEGEGGGVGGDWEVLGAGVLGHQLAEDVAEQDIRRVGRGQGWLGLTTVQGD